MNVDALAAEYGVAPDVLREFDALYESWLAMHFLIRCRDCIYFFRDATPHDEDCPHFCSKHGIDMDEDDGYCSWGRRRGE